MSGVWVFVLLLVLAGLFAVPLWLHRVWKRRKSLSPLAKGLALVAMAGLLSGGFGTLVGLVKAFGAVGGASIDPSQKARILAEGISEAMNCTAFGILVFIPSALGVFFLLRGKTTEPK